MPPVVNATVGSASANSYTTRAEADLYYTNRLFSASWTGSTEAIKDAALIMATRVLDMMLSPYKYFVPPTTGVNAQLGYYRTRPQWTGAPVDNIQRLAWPRSGMFDRNGNEISELVLPIELKEAIAELAGQLITADRTLDNDIAAQGITDIKAGPVGLSFAPGGTSTKMLPDAVLFMLVPSWVTAEIIEWSISSSIGEAQFDVVSE